MNGWYSIEKWGDCPEKQTEFTGYTEIHSFELCTETWSAFFCCCCWLSAFGTLHQSVGSTPSNAPRATASSKDILFESCSHALNWSTSEQIWCWLTANWTMVTLVTLWSTRQGQTMPTGWNKDDVSWSLSYFSVFIYKVCPFLLFTQCWYDCQLN